MNSIKLYKYLFLFLVLGLSSTNIYAQGYNLKMGPVAFNLTGRLGLSWSDNINYTDNRDARSDLAIVTGLNFEGNWQFSRYNELNFSLGLEYRKYLQYSEYDTFNNFVNVNPESKISFQFKAGDIIYIVSDELIFQTNPADARLVDENGNEEFDVISYTSLLNKLSVDANWELNENTQVLYGIWREDLIPISGGYDYLERVQHGVYGHYLRQLYANLLVGFRTAYFITEYNEDFQNDSDGYTVGLTFDWNVTELINVTFSPTWMSESYDYNGFNQDQSGNDSMSYVLGITHELNEDYTHILNLYRSYRYGYINNYTRLTGIEYRYNFTGYRYFKINGGFGWEEGVDSGGTAPEDYDRFNFDIGFNYQFTNRLNTDFRYYYSKTSSNIGGRDYDRNAIEWMFNYDF